MKLGHDSNGRRLSVYETALGDSKGMRLGENIGLAFSQALNRQGKVDMLDRRVASYIGKAGTISASPETARLYLGAIDDRETFGTKGYRWTRLIIESAVELRVTPIESEEIVAEGVLQSANFQDGSLTLELTGGSQETFDFAKIKNTGRGYKREYVGSELLTDFEVTNPEVVYMDLYPLAQDFRL